MSGVTIAVSGAAGDIGLGAARILREVGDVGAILGIDIKSEHAGLAVFDGCATCPRADDPAYLDWVQLYLQQVGATAFLPTSEAEIRVLAGTGHTAIGGARLLITDRRTVDICLDKHACLQFLHERGIPVPAHGVLSETAPSVFPVIVKPRSGQGSKGLTKVLRADDLPSDAGSALVWQELLGRDDAEYTCAVFRSGDVFRTLLLRRTLQGGFTNSGEVVADRAIEDYVQAIASAIAPVGPINVQLRMTDRGPLLFEINPRLSSTLVFRDRLGFQDLRWWLASVLDRQPAPYTPPAVGTRIFRGVQEYILPPRE